jgi:cytochrome c556
VIRFSANPFRSKSLSAVLVASLALGTVATLGSARAETKSNDPTIIARQELMDKIKNASGVLGGMAGGKIDFDQTKAAEAAAALAAAAASIPAHFETEVQDKATEGKPEIWLNFADFTSKADALYAAAQSVDSSSAEGLKTSMGPIGGACKACHSAYRM